MADPVTMLGMKAIGWVTAPIVSELFKKCANYLSFHASEKLRQLGPKVLLIERAMEATGISKKDLKERLEKIDDILNNAYKFVEHLKFIDRD
ncbi:hypothetical protein TRIUR3_15156 [Triticum urartu]|uniref:Rx N-terminal domain-containing protein n=1 Tax=Triticum urartu TaxID=4572 RepID=M8A1L7_TRIUA|nr:hypothetical protein TRIUR3_15156 [Triticum urartu]